MSVQRARDIVVGTDGSPASDRAVRQAARAALDRGSTLHVVCRLARMTNCAERKLARELPADIAWTAGRGAQQEVACSEALETAEHAAPGVDVRLHVSYSRLNSAVQAIAVPFDAEVFGLSAGASSASSGEPALEGHAPWEPQGPVQGRPRRAATSRAAGWPYAERHRRR